MADRVICETKPSNPEWTPEDEAKFVAIKFKRERRNKKGSEWTSEHDKEFNRLDFKRHQKKESRDPLEEIKIALRGDSSKPPVRLDEAKGVYVQKDGEGGWTVMKNGNKVSSHGEYGDALDAAKKVPWRGVRKESFNSEDPNLDEMKLHFDADDANNTINAKKMAAHLNKRGISSSHEPGSGHHAYVNVNPKNDSDKAYVRNKVKGRYDIKLHENLKEESTFRKLESFNSGDPLTAVYESSKATRKTDEDYFAEMCEAVRKVGGDHIPDEARQSIRPGFFTMDHVHDALNAPDLATSKKVAMGHVEAHPNAKPQSKAKAKAAILNARSNLHVAQAMTNMLLAHPSQGLKVIQPGNSAARESLDEANHPDYHVHHYDGNHMYMTTRFSDLSPAQCRTEHKADIKEKFPKVKVHTDDKSNSEGESTGVSYTGHKDDLKKLHAHLKKNYSDVFYYTGSLKGAPDYPHQECDCEPECN